MDLNLPLILILAGLHIWAGKLRLLDLLPQRRLHSLGGGIAIAYVFLGLLPDLSQAQQVVESEGFISSLMQQVYLLALIGATLFLGLDLLAKYSRSFNQATTGKDCTTPAVFWLHIGLYGFYNALFGYLLNHTSRPIDCLLLFGAIAFHYLVNDHNLRQHHQRSYDKFGRWLLAAAIFAGWLLGQIMPVGEISIAAVTAFLAGGAIVNVIAGELPKAREDSFWFFTTGAGVYALILTLVQV